MFDGLAGSWDLSLDRTVEWMMEAEPDMRYWRAEELRAWMSNDRATAEFREDGSFAIDVLESESAHRDRWTLTGVTSPDGHLRLQSHRMTGLDEQPYASWSLVGTYERDASGYRVHLSDATTGADYGTTLIHVGKAEIRFQHDGGVPFRHMVLLRR